MKTRRFLIPILYISALLLFTQCDKGLEPPQFEPEPFGAIQGTVTYTGEWPPERELNELIFVPLPFKPNSILDLLGEYTSGNLRSSERLQFFVESDTFFVDEVENGAYVYNIIAQNYGSLLQWRPVGVYTDNDGVIIIEGDTVSIHIHVDFDNPPPFPPE